MTNFFLDLHQVRFSTTLSKSTIYRLMEAGEFPRPRKISSRRVVWRADEIKNWIDSK